MGMNVAGFVDVGFVRAAVAKACGIEPSKVRLDAAALVQQVERIADSWDGLFLRVYWYDGQHPQSDPRHGNQRKYLDAVAAIPGIQLRLGHITSHTPAWHEQLHRALDKCGVDRATFERHFKLAPEYQQKGVDTLMVLDIVRLAQRSAYDIAVVFSGDRDICEAVRAAQDEGRRVTLLVPDDRSAGAELRSLADRVITFTDEELRALHRGKLPVDTGATAQARTDADGRGDTAKDRPPGPDAPEQAPREVGRPADDAGAESDAAEVPPAAVVPPAFPSFAAPQPQTPPAPAVEQASPEPGDVGALFDDGPTEAARVEPAAGLSAELFGAQPPTLGEELFAPEPPASATPWTPGVPLPTQPAGFRTEPAHP
jgi:uncharacterized LabA/DUF88 family protein